MNELPGTPGGWRVKEVDGYYVDVVPTRRSARILWQDAELPPRSPQRAWCYFGMAPMPK
jgi:hypothetical protein